MPDEKNIPNGSFEETADEVPENAGQGPEETTADEKEQEERSILPAQSRRTNILWVFAGLYLIYNGYNLCKSVISGAEGASPWFIVAGAAFVGIGGFLLIRGGLNLSREEKAKRVETEKVQTETKKMSISERARLAEGDDLQTENAEEDSHGDGQDLM